MANSRLLEFRHWAVESSDEKRAVLKHKDGHSMTVALKALPQIQQDQIKRIKMDKGGKVDYKVSTENNLDPDKTAGFREALSPTPKPKPQPQAEPQPQSSLGEASGPLQSYEKGGYTSAQNGEESQDTAPASRSLELLGDSDSEKSPGHSTHITINAAPQAQSPATAQPAVQPPLKPAQHNPTEISGQQGQGEMIEGYKTAVNQQQSLLDNQRNLAGEMEQHVNEFSQHVKDIDPSAYLQSMSDKQKEGTAIGLFLGGVGGGGRGNVALDFLDKQIDRNIAAQQKNIDNKNTVVGAYNALYGNENVATSLAKANIMDILDNKVKLAALKIGTPQAAQNAQQFSQNAQAQKQSLIQQAAQTLSTQPEGNPFKVQPILSADAESRYPAIQYNPNLKQQFPEITRQYNGAVQADKALNALGDTFHSLSQETNGISGRVHRMGQGAAGLAAGVGAGLGTVVGAPAAGAALGAAAGEGLHALTNTEANRRYDSDKTAVLGYVSSALKGTNIGSGQIQEIVDKNSPEAGDSPETLQKKYQNIVDFIHNHTDTSLLGNARLLGNQ